MTRPLNALAIVAIMALAPVPSFAISGNLPQSNPSFNCARATTNAELAICQRADLAAKDRAIATLFTRVNANTPRARRAAFASDQAAFNRSRERCYAPSGERDACLERLMEDRIFIMNQWTRTGFRMMLR